MIHISEEKRPRTNENVRRKETNVCIFAITQVCIPVGYTPGQNPVPIFFGDLHTVRMLYRQPISQGFSTQLPIESCLWIFSSYCSSFAKILRNKRFKWNIESTKLCRWLWIYIPIPDLGMPTDKVKRRISVPLKVKADVCWWMYWSANAAVCGLPRHDYEKSDIIAQNCAILLHLYLKVTLWWVHIHRYLADECILLAILAS